MSQELKPKRTIPPERLAVLAKWGGNPHEEEVYWMAEELQRARAQLATHSDAHLLRSHEALVKHLRLIEHKIDQHLQGQYAHNNAALGVALMEARAALTEAAALEENGNG
jgi:hypothetical protein